MKINILNILFSFCLFSIFGWILEVVYRSFRNRRFLNPGLLKGPYLPLYGTGSVILIACIPLVHESNFLVKALVYFVATTGLELIAGMGAQYFFHARLWDYSEQRFQYKGHICIEFSICWILLAFVFEYLIFPQYQIMFNFLAPGIKWVFTGAVTAMMLIDFIRIPGRGFYLQEKNRGR